MNKNKNEIATAARRGDFKGPPHPSAKNTIIQKYKKKRNGNAPMRFQAYRGPQPHPPTKSAKNIKN